MLILIKPVIPKMSSLILIMLLLFNIILIPLNTISSAAFTGSIQVELTHVDANSNSNHSKAELIQRAVARSKHRLSTLITNAEAKLSTHAPLRSGRTEYIMDLAIGSSPALAFSAIVDTGSDLLWTQCQPCTFCYYQPTPIFDPSKSSTFRRVPCSSELCKAFEERSCSDSTCHYVYGYTDRSSTQGVVATETFTVGSVAVPGIAFGCGNYNNGAFTEAAGIVGLGRGELSLISQMGVEKFSYCLTPLGSTKKGSLLLGSLPYPSAQAVISTPIVRNKLRPVFYHITLNGITVGGTLLDIPSSTFAINSDGSGGMIIDSGTAVTFLEYAAYDKVADAFGSQIKNLNSTDQSVLGLDLCYELPPKSSPDTLNLPKLVFHFEGGDLELPPRNCFGVDGDTSSICLMMAGSSGMSVLGNFQQQNLQVLYDLGNDMLSWYFSNCG